MHNLQCAKRADFRADPAAGAVLFNGKVCIDQFKGALGAD